MHKPFVSLTADIAPATLHPIARLSIATLKPHPADTSNESFGSNESSWRKRIYEVL